MFGDLAFNGIGENAGRTSLANNLQAEGTYRLAPNHTLRGGILVTAEHVTANTNSAVLDQTGTDSFGNPIYATTPSYYRASSAKTSFTYSAYLQDEWKALPKVTVNYGARFDVVNGYTTGSQLSPRLNMVWQATPTTTFHAGYARYFTPPPQELVSTDESRPLCEHERRHPRSRRIRQFKNEVSQLFRHRRQTTGVYPASRWASTPTTNSRATCSTKGSSARRLF